MRVFKKIISIILRVGISVVLLIFLFRQVDKKSLMEIIRNTDKNLLIWAFLVYSLSYVFCLYRWEMLLKTAKIHLSLKRVIISFAGGIFFNLFLPSTIGGDFVRSIDLAVHTKRPKEVVATVILDRLSGFVALVFIALVALLFGWRIVEDKSVMLSISIIAAILASILLVSFNNFLFSKVNKLLHSPTAGRIREALKNLHHEIFIFRHHKKIILYNLILSILVQAITPITFYITALSMGIKINILYFFIFLPIITAITLLPISIGGLGIREYTTKLFFVKAGVSANLSVAMSLLNSLFIFICAGIAGLVYILTMHHQRPKTS